MQKRTMIIGGVGAAVALVLVGAGITFAATELFDDDDRVSAVEDTTPGTSDSDTSTNGPSSSPSGSPTGSYTDDDGNTLSDEEREKVEEAALAATGGGRVTDIDREDDESDHLYDVEVTFDDGSDWDLEITADFQVVEIDRD